MARHTRLHWAPAAAILIPVRRFRVVLPRSTRDMLPLSAEGGCARPDGLRRRHPARFRAPRLRTTVLRAGGQRLRPPPTALPGPFTGDICVCPPAACAWITPPRRLSQSRGRRFRLLYDPGLRSALYQKIQDLIPQNA